MDSVRDAGMTDAECDAIRRRELVAARMLTGGGTQRSIAYQYALIRAAFAAGAASVPSGEPVAWLYVHPQPDRHVSVASIVRWETPAPYSETPLYAATGVTK